MPAESLAKKKRPGFCKRLLKLSFSRSNRNGVVMKRRGLSLLAFLLITACGSGQDQNLSTAEFEKSVANNEKLAQEVERLRDERSQISTDLQTNNEKVSQLQQRIDDLNKSGTQVESAYKTQLDTQNQTLADYKAELAKLQVQLANAPTAEQQRMTQQKITDLEGKARNQDAQIARLQQELNAAKNGETAAARRMADEIKAARAAYDSQVSKLNAMEAANAKMTQDLAAQQDANRKLQEQASALQAKNAELQKSLDAANARIKELENSLATLQGRYAELKDIYTKTQDDLSKTKIDLGAAQASAAALQAELNALKLKYEQLETKNQALEAEVQKAKADAAKARAEADKAKADAAAANAAAAAAKQQAAAAATASKPAA
jgi:colicin import membrane protein